MEGYLKPAFSVLIVAAIIFVVNLATGGGLFAVFRTSWRAPDRGDLGSQAICNDSCSCREDEHCVDGTCRKWGCVVSRIGRGGCPEHAVCQKVQGVPVCVRAGTDPSCN